MSEKTIKSKPPPDGATAEKEPGSGRLIATLGIAGLLSGIILVSSYLFTLPVIQANRAKALQEAIYRVLPGTTRFQPLIMEGDRLISASGEENTGDQEAPRVFAGYDEEGTLTGFAISAEEPGFQDLIGGIFGFDPAGAAIIGFEVLESKETPGLGDKIIKDADFQANFSRLSVDPEIVAVKSGARQNPNEVEAITGATISSKAVVRLLNKGLAEWRPLLEAYTGETKRLSENPDN